MMIFNDRQAGIYGGTLTGLIPLISSEELFRTLILAGAGAIVSFFISYFLQRLLPRREENAEKRKGKQKT